MDFSPRDGWPRPEIGLHVDIHIHHGAFILPIDHTWEYSYFTAFELVGRSWTRQLVANHQAESRTPSSGGGVPSYKNG